MLFFTLLAVSLIGMRELYRAMKVQDEKINLLAVAGYLGAVLYYLAVLLDFERYGVLAIIFGLVLDTTWQRSSRRKLLHFTRADVRDISWSAQKM